MQAALQEDMPAQPKEEMNQQLASFTSAPTTELSGLRVLVVHAHPDDEAIWSGGASIDLAQRGAEVLVITCTLGEEGEAFDAETTALCAAGANLLGGYRLAELQQARQLMGVRGALLGAPGKYRDSGMAGSTAASHPQALVNNFAAALADLEQLCAQFAPQLIITYGPDGGYGHPDHIAAHRLVRSLSYRPQRIAWAVTDRGQVQAAAAQVAALPASWQLDAAQIAAVDSSQVHCRHQLSAAVLARQARAMRAHASQVWVADGQPHPITGKVATVSWENEATPPPVAWVLTNHQVQFSFPAESYSLGGGVPFPAGSTCVAAGLSPAGADC